MHYDDELFDEEKEISIDELVEALSGEDEDGDPKSVVECSLYKVETTEDGTLEKINEIPAAIFNNDLLAPDGIAIIEHPGTVDFSSEPNFFEHRRYGSVNFSIFKRQ